MSEQAEPAINDDPGMPSSHKAFAARRKAQLKDAIRALHAEAWNYGLRQGLVESETSGRELQNAYKHVHDAIRGMIEATIAHGRDRGFRKRRKLLGLEAAE